MFMAVLVESRIAEQHKGLPAPQQLFERREQRIAVGGAGIAPQPDEGKVELSISMVTPSR